jgi:hypothetical protein
MQLTPMLPNDKKAPAPGNRREMRKRTLMTGRIVHQEGGAPLDCTIVDLSASGARIRTSPGHVLPSHFHLINMRERTAHEVKVVWQKDQFAGLHFDSSYALGGSVPEHLQYLRKLWMDYATR